MHVQKYFFKKLKLKIVKRKFQKFENYFNIEKLNSKFKKYN